MKKYYVIFLLLFTIFYLAAQNAENKFTPVTPLQIKELLNKSEVKNKHPRLYFNENDNARVIKFLADGDVLIKTGYAVYRKESDSILQKPLLTYHLDDAKLRVTSVHDFARELPSLLMMYLLDRDTACANRVIRQFELLKDYPDWGANRHFLDTGIGSFNFAFAYDVLYFYLTEQQRTMFQQAVMKHALLPGKEQLKNNEWWSNSNHNWNGICNGGLIMAALAMFEANPDEMSEIIALAINKLPKYINSFEPDGQSEEGLMYWGYGLMYTTITLESMQRVLGSAFGLDQMPGFKKTGWFPAYISGPVASLNIGDDPLKTERSRSFFWFAKNYKDTALASMQYELCMEAKIMNWMEMFYYDPQMLAANSTERFIPFENHIHGIEVMTLRDGWGKDALFVSMHGGNNFANHGHLDAGSFDIQAMGEVWANGNLGRDDYTNPGYFSKTTKPDYHDKDTLQTIPGRWHFYRLRAEGKNCLVFNPSTRPDQDEKASAILKEKKTGDDESSYTLNLTNCYSRDVTSYFRKISLNKVDEFITVEDEFDAKKSSLLWWSMHTRAAVKIEMGGKTAILQIKDKKMRVEIKSPSHAAFSILGATYLPGESFPLTRNSENLGFNKLAIRLDEMKSGNIKVQFTPIRITKINSKN